MQGVRLTRPAFGQGLDANHPDPPIMASDRLGDCGGVVVASIVDDEHFVVWVILSEQRAKAGFDIRRFVLGRDEDRDARSVTTVPAGRFRCEESRAADDRAAENKSSDRRGHDEGVEGNSGPLPRTPRNFLIHRGVLPEPAC